MSEPAASRAPSAAAGGRGRFTPWGLLLRTLGVWLRNLPAFTAVGVILDLPLAALELRGVAANDPGDRALLLLALLSWFVWLLTTGALSYGVLQWLGGMRPGAIPMLSTSARALWPLAVVGGLYSSMVLLGFFAMVLPGVFVLVVGYLAIPALLAEPELGAEGALRRSVTLTQGHRTALLAVVALLVAVGFAGPLGAGWLVEDVLGAPKPLAVAVVVLVDALLGGIACACPAVAYHDLRVRGGEPAPRVRTPGWP